MAAIDQAPAPPAASGAGRARRPASQRDGFTPWRWLILILAGVYFLIPLYAAVRFAGWGSFGSVIHQPGFASSLGLSVRLAAITTVITLALMLPTAVHVHLRLPRLRRLLEGITILPIVIPPVVLIVGLLQVAPGEPEPLLRADPGPGRPEPGDRARRTGRAARPVRLRQDHRAAHPRRLRGRRLRRGAGRRAGRRAGAGRPARHGHGVPELQPLPAPDGAGQRGLRAADAQEGRGAAARRGPPSCWTWSGWPRRPGGTRTSSPAASSSASRWPGRSPSSRGCCCSTSRCPRWTPRCATSCASEIRRLQQRARHHHAVRHARPGGGAVDGRPGRRDADGPAGAVRRAQPSCTPARPPRSSPSSSAR